MGNLVDIILVLVIHMAFANVIPDEHKLVESLGLLNVNIYDNSVRPVYNASKNVIVDFGLTLIQIQDMDEKNQVLVTDVWLTHKWTDDRLKWNSSDYNSLYIIRIPAHKLWLPDIVLYNNADDFTSEYMSINAMVSNEGTVFWSPPSRFRSSCKIDITFFPFDSQRCILKFGSWTYDKAQVDLVASVGEVDVSTYISSGEWMLIKYTIERHETVYPISPDVFPDVRVVFVIQRRILYYILNIVFPCFWLNILSVLSFYLPSDAGEKVTLSITVLLSYSVFLLVVAESMPPTSESVPLIGIYLTVSMSTASISVGVTVLVLKIHHSGTIERGVPKWMSFVVFRVLAKILNCCCPAVYRYHNSKSKISDVHTKEEEKELLNIQENSHQPKKHPNEEENLGQPQRRESVEKEITDRMMSSLGRKYSGLPVSSNYLKRVIALSLEIKRERENSDDWKQVAQVFDRLFFIVFLSITIVSAFVTLIIVPSYHYKYSDGL